MELVKFQHLLFHNKIHVKLVLGILHSPHYKTLEILKELGMLQELSIPQGQARLDPNMNLHINMICLQCGKIIDSDSESLQEDLKRVAAEAKFSTALQRIDIYGKCEKCAVSRKPS